MFFFFQHLNQYLLVINRVSSSDIIIIIYKKNLEQEGVTPFFIVRET